MDLTRVFHLYTGLPPSFFFTVTSVTHFSVIFPHPFIQHDHTISMLYFLLSPEVILNNQIQPPLFRSSIFQPMATFHLHKTILSTVLRNMFLNFLMKESFRKIPRNIFVAVFPIKILFGISVAYSKIRYTEI
jgi:hypothetical protein